MSNTSILDAIRVVKENERIAAETYAAAAKKITNYLGIQLFKQLSEFEQYHYSQVSLLEKSLVEKGTYITYAGQEFPLPPVFEIKAAQEANRKSAVGIVLDAIDLEKLAEKSYADLADIVPDADGHAMFRRLAEEEHKHYRMLTEAYWSLTNMYAWNWSSA